MKKPYLRSALITAGFLAGALIVDAQTGAGGGAAAGGAAGAGTAAGAAGSAATGTAGTAGGVTTGTSGTAGTAGGIPVRGTSGTTGGRAQPAGTINTIGGASALEANPNNVGGTINSGGISAGVAPGTSQGVQGQSAAQMNTLPTGVQSTLGTFAANGQLGSVAAVPGQPGTFRATVTQNGVPMEITVGSNGQILSRAPVTGTPGTAAQGAQSLVGTGVGSASGTTPFVTGAVLPPTAVVMDELPNTIQEAIRAQLGGTEASRVMQQRTANGVNYLVTYDQNGRPMTLVVGPDGRIISNGPAAPSRTTATASVTTGNTNTAASREVTMTLDELPNEISEALKQAAPYAEVRTVTREQRVGGDVYVIAVRDGDRAGELTIDDDGKVIRDTRRDLSALTARVPARNDDRPEGLPLNTLPVAIQNAVKAYATASDIRSITLGSDTDGRTVYDVVFYRDGRRDRMIVRKDGTLMRIEENVSPALELASTKPAVLAIGDLPQEVQDTVRRQTDNVVIKSIDTKEVANQTVYSVRWETNGAPVELLVSRDGVVIQPEGSIESDRVDAAAPAILDREEQAVVKVVDDTPGTAEVTRSVGAAAATESDKGVSVSTSVSTGDDSRTAVKLEDAPQAVQDTAKKLAGAGIIESVSPKLEAEGMVYDVRYQDNGETRSVIIDRSGKVLPESTTSEP